MGSGTLASNPRFECHGIKAPPPAPPHAADCEPLEKYEIKNAWDQGMIVGLRIKAAKWEVGRTYTITYWGQTITAANPQGASLKNAEQDHAGNTVLQMDLGERPAVSDHHSVWDGGEAACCGGSIAPTGFLGCWLLARGWMDGDRRGTKKGAVVYNPREESGA